MSEPRPLLSPPPSCFLYFTCSSIVVNLRLVIEWECLLGTTASPSPICLYWVFVENVTKKECQHTRTRSHTHNPGEDTQLDDNRIPLGPLGISFPNKRPQMKMVTMGKCREIVVVLAHTHICIYYICCCCCCYCCLCRLLVSSVGYARARAKRHSRTYRAALTRFIKFISVQGSMKLFSVRERERERMGERVWGIRLQLQLQGEHTAATTRPDSHLASSITTNSKTIIFLLMSNATKTVYKA